jgi:hypothetical protein
MMINTSSKTRKQNTAVKRVSNLHAENSSSGLKTAALEIGVMPLGPLVD